MGWKRVENETLKSGSSPTRAFKLCILNNLRLLREFRLEPHFFAVDGDGGRREFGLRGQRRGTEIDMGTAANSLSGYHAPGLKRILACLRPWS